MAVYLACVGSAGLTDAVGPRLAGAMTVIGAAMVAATVTAAPRRKG